MELADRNVVVTGAGSGIGRALAHRFAAERPRALVRRRHRRRVGRRPWRSEVGGHAVTTDVSHERRDPGRSSPGRASCGGPIDLFCSNAGVGGPGGGPEVSDEEWQRTWKINVMAHVWAARAVLPEMVERGEGYLMSTASAAGLLTQVSALAYSVTKHAAVAAGRVAGDHLRRRRDQGLVPVPARGAHADARDGARRQGRRGARCSPTTCSSPRRCRRGGAGGDPRGAVPDPPARDRPQVRGAQGRRPRALADRHAPAGARRSRSTELRPLGRLRRPRRGDRAAARRPAARSPGCRSAWSRSRRNRPRGPARGPR